MPSVWCPLANWKTHLEEPYESRGSRTVPRGAGGEIPLAYSTACRHLLRLLDYFVPLLKNFLGPPSNFHDDVGLGLSESQLSVWLMSDTHS